MSEVSKPEGATDATVAKTEAPAEPGLTFQDLADDLKHSLKEGYSDTIGFFQELKHQLTPDPKLLQTTPQEALEKAKGLFFVPYFPAFHSPGWLVRYVVGPYDNNWFESIFADFWAGITVALTLIPQALSYAQLANLPPINGLYCAILPSAVYTFFGSSLQLAVGPVAVVSLLTGTLVVKYVPDFATNTEDAVNLAGVVALCCGIILTVLSVVNAGNIIRFVSHPVMSGFTSGAACVIALNQIKAAFGFGSNLLGETAPQVGNEGYDYNYQVMKWYRENWNVHYPEYHTNSAHPTPKQLIKMMKSGQSIRNHLATKICWGTFTFLIVTTLLKGAFKSNPVRAKSKIFKVWQMFASLSSFIAIIICAHVAWKVHHDDNYFDSHVLHNYNSFTLKVVGQVTPGLHFLRKPKIVNMNSIFWDTIELTLISFMESYSVARKIAVARNELHILNANQEMWANGAANLLACVSSAYPVSGSFSRSSLNHASGARTPLSKITTMIVVIIALRSLTSTFQYIPQAALAAVILAAVYNLIGFSDFWEAFKHSKKDFFVMLLTFILVLTFDTSIGLVCGLAASLLIYLLDIVYAGNTQPVHVKKAKDNNGVDVVELHSDMTFLTATSIKNFICALTNVAPPTPSLDTHNRSEYYYQVVTTTLDSYLKSKVAYIDTLPSEIVINMDPVRVIDITGLETLKEIIKESKLKKVKVSFVRINEVVERHMIEFGLIQKEKPVYEPVETNDKDSVGNGVELTGVKNEV